jgi:UDPglucose--hexose-1-phosphate uridylyltransferase
MSEPGRFVIYSGARRSVPRNNQGSAGAFCPFCPGHEDSCSDEVLRSGGPGRSWDARVIKNLYPVVSAGTEGPGLVNGRHEVVVLSPDHERHFDRLSLASSVKALRLVIQRVSQLQSEGWASVVFFANYGPTAGASQAHPHGQIIAMDRVPPVVNAENGLYSDEVGCPLCQGTPELEVARSTGLVVLASAAPVVSCETLIAPAVHGGRLGSLSATALAGPSGLADPAS